GRDVQDGIDGVDVVAAQFRHQRFGQGAAAGAEFQDGDRLTGVQDLGDLAAERLGEQGRELRGRGEVACGQLAAELGAAARVVAPARRVPGVIPPLIEGQEAVYALDTRQQVAVELVQMGLDLVRQGRQA